MMSGPAPLRGIGFDTLVRLRTLAVTRRHDRYDAPPNGLIETVMTQAAVDCGQA